MLSATQLLLRLNSFREWKSEKNFAELACAGFRCSGQNERVECNICGARVIKWAVNDYALQCHARLGPQCKFLEEVGLTENYKIAKYPTYATYKIRLDSMSTVPEEYLSSLPSVDKIAFAGLYYLGSLDRMCCFYCGLVLRDWESTTDALEVHQQFRGDCFFIVTLVGRKSGNDTGVSRTLQIVENHQAMKFNSQSFTYRLGQLLLKSEESKSLKVHPKPCDTVDEKHDTQDQGEFTKQDILSGPFNLTNKALSLDITDSALQPKIEDHSQSIDELSLDEISEEDLFTSGACSLPPSKQIVNEDQKTKARRHNKQVQSTAWAKHKKNSQQTLDLPVLKRASNTSATSSGYGSTLSIDSRQEVTDGSKSINLPPIYNDCNFSELPMVKAVLEAGICFEQIVKAVCNRYTQYGDVFNDASSLMLAILDSDV